jgi:hypothetical protein
MTTEKVNESSLLDDDNQLSKEGKKRISYVTKDLKTMIDFVAKVYNQLGHTAYHSNKAIAAVHGLSPDSIKQHLTSAQQYKILTLKHGTGYKITDHFQKLYLPKNDNERRAAVIESLKNAETYQQLFKDYEYHVVPTDGVKNHFIRTFGFKDDIAVKAAEVFLQNLKDFELLDSRGVLTSALSIRPIIPEVNTGKEDPTTEPNGSHENTEPEAQANGLPARQRVDKLIFQSELDTQGKKQIPIYLTDSKQALLVYPDDISEDDIELVKHQIDGILLRIKLESKKRGQQN